MPITKSAKKALKQNIRKRARNIQRKQKIKKILKEIKKLISEKKIKKARTLLPQVYKLLDKAAKNGLIKKNTVARKKSRISKSINKTKVS